MDIKWLKKNSFLNRVQVRKRLDAVDGLSFARKADWVAAMACIPSDLGPQARDYCWLEFMDYGVRKPSADLEAVRDCKHMKSLEYPDLPPVARVIAAKIMEELRYLVELEVTTNDFYREVRWLLGQMLNAAPNIMEACDPMSRQLTGEYALLNKPYGIIECILKTLGDPHVRAFYDEYDPNAFIKHVSVLLEAPPATSAGN